MLRWPLRRWTRAMGFLGSTLAAFAVGAERAPAQFAPSIPYQPYQRQYMSFSYPTVVNPGMPNQARFNLYGSLAPNPYGMLMPGSDLRAFESVDPWLSGGRGGRTGTASPAASLALHDEGDAEYRETRELRQQLYEEWQKERDPQRRLELRRQIEEADATLRTLLASPRRRTGTATSGASGGTASTAPALSQNAARRRTGATGPGATPSVPSGGGGTAAPGSNSPAATESDAGIGVGEGANARPSPSASLPGTDASAARRRPLPTLESTAPGARGATAPSDLRSPIDRLDRRRLGPTTPARPGPGTRGMRRTTPRPAAPTSGDTSTTPDVGASGR